MTRSRASARLSTCLAAVLMGAAAAENQAGQETVKLGAGAKAELTELTELAGTFATELQKQGVAA